MRFTLSSIFFLVAGFIFFIMWAVMSYLLDEVHTAFVPYKAGLDTGFADVIDLLPTAFGVICAIFVVTGIVLIFIMDSLADEPEMYWR